MTVKKSKIEKEKNNSNKNFKFQMLKLAKNGLAKFYETRNNVRMQHECNKKHNIKYLCL